MLISGFNEHWPTTILATTRRLWPICRSISIEWQEGHSPIIVAYCACQIG